MLKLLIFLIILIILIHNSGIRKSFIKNNKDFFYKKSSERDSHIHSTIEKYINPPLKILNFGCGLNTYTDKLKSLGYDVTPVDIVDMSIGNSEVYVYDGINIPIHRSGTKYDVAVISTVLHHIPKNKQLGVLESIKSVSNNIIVLEDYIDGSVFSFLKTSFFCSATNVSLIDHPFAFRTQSEWLELFYKLNPKNIFYNHGAFELYVLQF
jgi:SAM-dependent methyltransferase